MTGPSRDIEILIDRAGPLLRAAVVEDGRLTDLHIDSAVRPSRLGEIVLGRVDRIVTALNGAFVDIGGTAGLLNNADLRTAAPTSRKAARAGTTLRAGQPVLVQVKAEPGGGKGPSLTMDVTLPGRFLVMTPFKPGISISRRLAQGDARGRLSQMISEITGGLGGGWIVRGSALGVETELLASEAEALALAWRQIERQVAGDPPRTLSTGSSAAVRAVVETGGRRIARIYVSDAAIRGELADLAPDAAALVEIRQEALFDRYDIEGAIRELSGRTVPLPGGGSLVIDRTEALTVIDVNGGERPNALATNLDAVEEIARQLRLRNIGGIVIVDFINMTARRDVEHLLGALGQATADDPAGVNVYGMSKLGLVELTRQRRGPPLSDLLASCGVSRSD
ncbi:ribonuclease E/G [Skermanella mucosa]|uniref:ribonuclease E/G n=1 Tax=Skermanella mucosa TaxID=1789672 RepID=UPI00192BB8D4|nr:ribonuclease E/G [Skermanella mucosa]UEM23265.1 ribonuclease E/G [Skermanella mucosa]